MSSSTYLIGMNSSGQLVLTNSLFANVAVSGSYGDLTGCPAIPNITRTTSTLTLSPVGTGATGIQISLSKYSSIKVTYATSTTVTLGGTPTSLVILKTCATNSSTESDWAEVGRTESDQPTTLSVTVGQQVKSVGQICTDIDPGAFVKAVNSGSGTHSETFVSGQQTIYG